MSYKFHHRQSNCQKLCTHLPLSLKSSKYWNTVDTEAKWTVPQYREGSSFTEYRQPEGWKTAYRRAHDTAIPHIKLKIFEIPFEKKLNTAIP